jgi:RecA/RadA recombinase
MAKSSKPKVVAEELHGDLSAVMAKYGLTTAAQQARTILERKVYPLAPLSLSLAIGEIDPVTGLPGIPAGTIAEFAGRSGTGKTMTVEQVALSVQADNPDNLIMGLFFEEPNPKRMESIGLDLDRILTMDYSDPEMSSSVRWAEKGLNGMTSSVEELQGKVKYCFIDSLGAMAMAKEIFDENDELKEVDSFGQFGQRARAITTFLHGYCRLDPATRPILVMLNHVKDKIDGMGPAALKNIILGENIKRRTLGGTGKDFPCFLRVEQYSSPIYELDGKVTHPLFGNRVQIGLETKYELFKNKFANDTGARTAKGKFLFEEQRFDIEEEVILYASYLGLMAEKSGWYTIGDKKYQGAKNAKKILREDPALCQALQAEITKNRNDLFKLGKPKTSAELD